MDEPDAAGLYHDTCHTEVGHSRALGDIKEARRAAFREAYDEFVRDAMPDAAKVLFDGGIERVLLMIQARLGEFETWLRARAEGER